MPEDKDSNNPPEMRMVTHKDEDYKSVYANNIQWGSTFLDIAFLFGQIEDIDENRVIRVNLSVKVTMSPQEAKIFQQIINEAITSYESRYGEIKTLRSDTPGIPPTELSGDGH
jgi:hypothetical protein